VSFYNGWTVSKENQYASTLNWKVKSTWFGEVVMILVKTPSNTIGEFNNHYRKATEYESNELMKQVLRSEEKANLYDKLKQSNPELFI